MSSSGRRLSSASSPGSAASSTSTSASATAGASLAASSTRGRQSHFSPSPPRAHAGAPGSSGGSAEGQPPPPRRRRRWSFLHRRRASRSRPPSQAAAVPDEAAAAAPLEEEPRQPRRRWWQRIRRSRNASDAAAHSPLQRRSLSPPGQFGHDDNSSSVSSSGGHRPLHAPPAARRISSPMGGGGLGEASRERRRSRGRASLSSTGPRTEGISLDIASLLGSLGGREQPNIQLSSNSNGDFTLVANVNLGGLNSASREPGDDTRRLRDEFLEAIAMAVLDQHEIETAEGELKRLEHQLEVDELRKSLRRLERDYDDARTALKGGSAEYSEDDLKGMLSRAAVARLMLKACVLSQRLLRLKSLQQHLSPEALGLELDRNLTMATIANLRRNAHMMDQMIEEERRLYQERLQAPPPAETDGDVPVADQIACQKFHIACLRARASGKLQIMLRRDQMYDDSKMLLEQLPNMQLRKRLVVSYTGEEGRDFGGMAREWFQALGAELLRVGLETGCLESANEDGSRVKIVAMDHISTKATAFFRLLGRAAGMALFHNKTLNFPCAKMVLQLIIGGPLHLHFLRELDEDLHRNLRYMLDNEGADELDLTFSVEERNADGEVSVVDLLPGGAGYPVDDSNKEDYVERLLRHRFRHKTQRQCSTIRRALCEVLPESIFNTLDANQLYLLIVGNTHIDVTEWRENTQYDEYEESSAVVQWFWDVVQEYPEEKRAKLLHFSTGASRLPVQGFAGLQGTHGTAPFTLTKNGVPESLPVGHTCSNRLDLPPYPSKTVLREKLDYAIAETEGFGIV